jgi:hypothetical protein
VNVQNGYELNELHNVYAPSPTNGQVLTYVSGNSRWEAATVADQSATNELQTLSVATNTATLSNSGGSVTIAGGGINTVGTAGSTITVTGTEVDGSVTNEIQTIDQFSLSGQTLSASLSSDGVAPSTVTLPVVGITAGTNVTVSESAGVYTINSSGGGGGSGITSLNGLTASTQTFATGTTGTDFNISSATSTHTFNLPTASATNRGALSNADWTTFNGKQNALVDIVTGNATGGGGGGRIAFWNTNNTVTGSNQFLYNSSSRRLAIGYTATAPNATIHCQTSSDLSTLFVAIFRNTTNEIMNIRADGRTAFLATNTATGTTGAQTINRPSGTVNFAAGATSLLVTNSLCTTASIVFAVVRTNDTTAYIKNVVPGAGSFTINLGAAATAETSVGFFIIN